MATSALKAFFNSFSRWFILLALAFALSRTHGTYGIEFFILVLFGGVLFTSVGLRKMSLVSVYDSLLLKGTLVFFLLRLLSHSSLVFATHKPLEAVFNILLVLSMVCVLRICLRSSGPFLIASFIFLSLGLLLVPWISPQPQVDVFTLSEKALAHLFSGVNPYAVEYQDKLSEPFGYRPGYSYPPGALLLSALSFKATGDARTILSSALVLTGIFLFKIGVKAGKSFVTSMLFALLWLAFPVNPLVIEHGWVDPLLVLTAVSLIYGLQIRNTILIVSSLGVHLCIKQYAPLTFFITLLWLWRAESFKKSFQTGLGALGIFLLVSAPFFLNAPKAFLQMAYFDVFGQAPRTESFTFYAFLQDTLKIPMPDWVTVLTLLICIFYFWRQWQVQKPGLSEWSLALFLTTFLGFIFARRAFCNYFHFSAIFLVLYLLYSFEEGPTSQNKSSPYLPRR